MAHIHTQPGQHDHTASAYIIRTDFDEPKLMLHLHRKINKYLQFGGHIELDETPWHAIAHELEEESGYSLDDLQLLQPSRRITSLGDAVVHPVPVSHSTHPFGNGIDHYHTDLAYAFIADRAPAIQPKEGESKIIKLVTRQELQQMDTTEIPDNVKVIGTFIFDEIMGHWHAISPRAYK